MVNRNKHSVTADLRTPLGVEIVKRLIADADIVVENYRKGTLERWGLGYDVLSAINPSLIMLRMTGFGQTGPNSHRSGFGTLAEGYSGYAYISGYPDRPPLLPGFGLADDSAGLMGAFLAMIALQEKNRSKKRGSRNSSKTHAFSTIGGAFKMPSLSTRRCRRRSKNSIVTH